MTELYRPAWVYNDDIEITQGQDWLAALGLDADELSGGYYALNTTGYTAAMAIRAPDANGPVQLAVSTASGEIVVGFSPAPIQRSTAYVAGQRGTSGSALFECTTGGTTDGSPVIFDDTINHTTNDGTVVWNCIGDDSTVSNLTIVITASMTAALTPWGRGVYSIEVFDTYGHSVFYQDGRAYLRQESTY